MWHRDHLFAILAATIVGALVGVFSAAISQHLNPTPAAIALAAAGGAGCGFFGALVLLLASRINRRSRFGALLRGTVIILLCLILAAAVCWIFGSFIR